MAEIVQNTTQNLARCAAALADGKLVAFPTETVYGLGGNALLESAVKQIYAVKGRPATDPLICHIDLPAKALKLWDVHSDPEAVELAQAIGVALWPGPLTIVFRADPHLPECVTGGSGYVGARVPSHPVALGLLHLVDFPVAGPSANTFGHVSPTTAAHVYADLAPRDPELLILDGGSCAVGIESTVLKVISKHAVEVLRRGRVTVGDIQAAIATTYPQTQITIRDTRSKFAVADAPQDGPGQMLTHYSPRVSASLLTPASIASLGDEAAHDGSAKQKVVVLRGSAIYPLATTALIDFNGILGAFKGDVLAYLDLSADGDVNEACFHVFEALRWSEEVAGAENVIFPFLSEWPQVKSQGELLAAVEDRLFRAASGTVAHLAVAEEKQ